jgi:hypothetical protein
MYESQGRQYIVFMSPPAGRGGGFGERPTTDGAGGSGSGAPPAPSGPHGYIAFALPKK